MNAAMGVPAFWAEADAVRRIPCVVSLYLVDGTGRPCIPPAVERAIDAAVHASGRSGLALITVLDVPGASLKARRLLDRAMAMNDAIVLFRCQSIAGSESLMDDLYSAYGLRMICTGQLDGATQVPP